jgi:hypothetical protein
MKILYLAAAAVGTSVATALAVDGTNIP